MKTDVKLAEFDASKTCDELVAWIRNTVTRELKKRGAIVGMSGGIDSSVVAALCMKALGPSRVVGVAIPEKDSSPVSLRLASMLADRLNINLKVEDITGALDGLSSYERRDEAIKREFPEYVAGDLFKITLQSNPILDTKLNIFTGTILDVSGKETSKRLSANNYLQIVAASNMKQRLRMTILYYHAELRNYAVVGTGNKNEHDLGFFVKFGDGGSDLQPIGHLFKTQIYKLASLLDIPETIINREPTTDTYPAEVSQEDFFFRLPFEKMDYIWEAVERGLSAEEIAHALHLTSRQVQNVIEDITRKQRSTEYLRLPALRVSREN